MHNMKRKLQSSRGASMIIAMVFMLICVFVGGSVLTAATANAYRIEHLSDQQEYLNERSAAMLIADNLRTTGSSSLMLTIHDSDVVREHIKVLPSGVIVDDHSAGAPDKSHVVTFTVTGVSVLNAMQRTVIEMAVRNYQLENHIPDVNVRISPFKYQGNSGVSEISSLDQFWFPSPSGTDPVSGTMDIQSSPDGVANFNASFFCGQDAEEAYDYVVTFGTFSQLEVRMQAEEVERKIPEIVQIVARKDDPTNTTKGDRLKTKTTRFNITWASPKITKGAVRS